MADLAMALATLSLVVPTVALRVGGLLVGGYSAGMRPEEVSRKLVGVEERWENMASSFVACKKVANSTGGDHVECDGFVSDFTHSCTKLASAMVQGSGGQRDVVRQYLDAVCTANPLNPIHGWREERCELLAAEVNAAMTDDAYFNREMLNLTSACRRFWTKFTKVAQLREEKEEADRAVEAKRKAKEQEAVEERHATDTKAQKAEEMHSEETAAEARRQEAESKRQEAESTSVQAETARAKAAEAAKQLAEAKAQAAAKAEEVAQNLRVKEAYDRAWNETSWKAAWNASSAARTAATATNRTNGTALK